ncbi:MAG: DNA polymerase subunit beta [Gammaproteobacteria bacterium]|nr:MAG: DNA polymerase subunit beta [Gammaproteobacteria bacterium]
MSDVLRAESPPPVSAWLFGSRGRGDAREDSDVDVAVLYAVTPPRTLEGAGFELSSKLESRLQLPVDLIVMNHTRPELVHAILSDGQLLFDDDPSKRIAFEIKSRNEYFDVLPYLRMYRSGKMSLRR